MTIPSLLRGLAWVIVAAAIALYVYGYVGEVRESFIFAMASWLGVIIAALLYWLSNRFGRRNPPK